MLLLLLLVVWATAAESSDCPARLAAAECELVRLRGPHGCPPGFTRLPTGCYRLLAEPCPAAEALERCRQQAAIPAVPATQYELQLLSDFVSQQAATAWLGIFRPGPNLTVMAAGQEASLVTDCGDQVEEGRVEVMLPAGAGRARSLSRPVYRTLDNSKEYSTQPTPDCAFANLQFYNLSFCLEDPLYPV